MIRSEVIGREVGEAGLLGLEGPWEALSRRVAHSVILEGYSGCSGEGGCIGEWGAMTWKD